MRHSCRAGDASRRAMWLAALCLPACGGGASDQSADGGRQDDARVLAPPASTGAPDATTCSDACGDASVGAMDAHAGPDATGTDAAAGNADASGADATVGDADVAAVDADISDTADAPDAIDYPPVTHNEVCHVTWPQPSGYSSGGDSFSLAVDPSGNTYAAITYSSSLPQYPPLDLGVASPGDPIGIAIAKVDPQCHLVWMREFGEPPGGAGAELSPGSIVADPTSSVTMTGVSIGPVDLGAGLVNGYELGFVLHLDADGSVVYSHAYPSDFPTMIGVQADGSAALLFFDYGAFECSLNSSFCDGGVPAEAGSGFYSFVQLDPTGSEVARNSFPGFPGVQGLGPGTFTDPSLDPAGMIWAIDNDADAGPSLQRLTQTGEPLWSQATGSADLVLGPAGGVVFSESNTPPLETFDLFGFDGGLSWTQTTRLASGVPASRDVAVDPTGAIYVGGQPSTGMVGVEVLDPQGRPQAIRAWGTGGSYYYRAFGVDPNGNAIVGGDSFDADGGFSYFLVKLGP